MIIGPNVESVEMRVVREIWELGDYAWVPGPSVRSGRASWSSCCLSRDLKNRESQLKRGTQHVQTP